MVLYKSFLFSCDLDAMLFHLFSFHFIFWFYLSVFNVFVNLGLLPHLRNTYPPILVCCILQLIDVCWAILIIKQFESILKIRELIHPNLHLSIYKLINIITKRLLRPSCVIYRISNVHRFFIRFGTVFE